MTTTPTTTTSPTAATAQFSRLTPTARLVYERLTELADAYGRVEISTTHLATLTHTSRDTVRRVINQLECRDILMRLPRVWTAQGRAGITRLQILTTTPPTTSTIEATPTPATSTIAVGGVVEAVRRDDVTGLADLAARLAVNTADSDALNLLAATVTVEGPAQFANIAATRPHMAGHSDAIRDTCQEAFLTFLDHAETIASADNPWAMWTRLTHHTITHPHHTTPTTMTVSGGLDYEDYETGPLARVVAALETAGLSHSVAVNAIRLTTRYVIQHHRYTDQARDMILTRLGITPEAGRELRRLIAGSRNGIHQPNCATATDGELAAQATRCAELLAGEPTPHTPTPAGSARQGEKCGGNRGRALPH